MKIKALKTESYAQYLPHLPIVDLVKGEVCEVSDRLGNRIIELKGGVEETETVKEEIPAKAEEVETPVEPKETAVVVNPEIKEKPSRKNRGGNRS